MSSTSKPSHKNLVPSVVPQYAPVDLNASSSPQQIQDFKRDYKQKRCIILVHWDACGHCQHFMPIWRQFCQSNPLVQPVSLERSVMDQISLPPISGFPTILLKIGNNMRDYSGERTAEGLHNFLRQHVPVKETSPLSSSTLKIVKISTPTKSGSSGKQGLKRRPVVGKIKKSKPPSKKKHILPSPKSIKVTKVGTVSSK